jgi:uncharacterized protein
MDVSRKGDLLLIRMYPGEEIVSSLIDVCRYENVSNAVVLSSIGQLEKFSLGYFVKRNDYDPSEFEEPHELISISGMISRTSKGYEPHLHACLGNRSKSVVGGHLIKGDVSITNETILQTGVPEVERIDNPHSGLRDLKVL